MKSGKLMGFFKKSGQSHMPHFVRVKKSTRARRMALRLDAKERLFHLIVPQGMSLKKAKEFVEEHERWMMERLRDLPRPVSFEHGSIIPVLGRQRDINIIKRKTLKTTDILLKQNEIIVLTNLDDPAPRIKRFLMKLAKEKLTELAEEKAEKLGKKIKDIHVRDTKSRWGSCASDGGISFSWRLILAPTDAMDYVVAHEVAHLKHMNHGDNFWKLCSRLSENFFEGHYWMDNHGQELMKYG
ncbi:MAG: M48 family metallopeptidase [Alphaproteobacteria bacterium]